MSAQILPVDSEERRLLEQAADWRLLGLLFECPTASWRDQVRALAREISDAEIRFAAEHALEEASEGLYHALFGPGGPAPARELSYQNSLEAGYLLSELVSYYNAFAYRPTSCEAPDHISVEAGFLGYLRLKEAYALACSEAEHAAVTHEAAQRFLEDHLCVLAEPLAAALGESGMRYLTLAGEALLCRTGPPRKVVHPSGSDSEVPVEGCAFDCSS
jgi:nitrate reductase assembly molybdenum cofactor insertion protein NarJ